MAGKRQHYSVGFKTKVALEALKRDLTIAQHGVHQALISSWKRQDGQFQAAIDEGSMFLPAGAPGQTRPYGDLSGHRPRILR